MEEQSGTRLNRRSAACKFPSESIRKKQLLRPRRIIMAVSLAFMLTATGLVYVLMLPTALPPPPLPTPLPLSPLQLTPHDAIAIDGDANFTATALLEGWPGDGSPENPFIIDGFEIDLGSEEGHCIFINNTRVSFIISNCNLTGATLAAAPAVKFVPPLRELPRSILNVGSGIHLYNVSNGELVSNTCNNNSIGIDLFYADSNTVSSNTCNNNTYSGINLWDSNSNTVSSNTCNNNTERGFYLYGSDSNIVTNNTCSSNTERGIWLSSSNSNTVASNNCSNNTECGIYLWASNSNTVATNICNSTGNHGIFLFQSDSNTMTNNTCNNNDVGINLDESDQNTLTNNICTNNRIGIYIDDEPESNTVENNTFSSNTEHDIVYESELEELAHQEYVAKQSVWFLAGCGMVLVVAVIAFVQFRRMKL